MRIRSFQILFTALLLGAMPSIALAAPAIDGFKCPEYRFEQKGEYTFAHMNPQAQEIGGVKFPGNGQILFRGAYESNPQFDFNKVMKALFGEKNWYMGSPMFWGITQVLTKQKSLTDHFIPSGGLPLQMKEYFQARKISRDIETLLSCAPGPGYSSETADVLAADLVNKAFHRLRGDNVENLYFNLNNPEYYARETKNLGFGNNAVDFVIATSYDQIATLYGKKVLVLHDRRTRGLDLGFYNYVHNNRFFDAWVDQGEINIPGYITADEVVGLQIRSVDRVRNGWGQKLPDSGIEYAIYPHKQEGKDVVLLLDGKGRLCVLKGSDGRYYACDRNWDGLMTEIVPYPRISQEARRNRIPLKGAFVLCDSDRDSDCEVPASLWDWYGSVSTSRVMPPEVQKAVASLKVNGRRVVYQPAPEPPKTAFDGIKVLSATYLPLSGVVADGDVTEAASKFLDGKESEGYQVKARFLGVHQLNEPREFELKWACNGILDKVYSIKIPAPAEGKSKDVKCPRRQP